LRLRQGNNLEIQPDSEAKTMKTKMGLLIVSAVVTALVVGHLTGQQLSKKPPPAALPNEQAADEAAIKKVGQAVVAAYMAGDAKALAAQWTVNGEYVADDGTMIRGRANIEKAYAALFGKKKEPTTAEHEVTSIRFPSKDTAIEEGYFKVRTGKEAPVSSRFSVLYVRDGGNWLMAVVREWPNSGVSLRDLEWLIGSWEARHGDTDVRTTYEWWGEKTFIRVNIVLKQGDRTVSSFQMICQDGSTGQLRSWTFDPDGSFGEATWTRDGKKWTLEAAGVLDNGNVLSAINILTRIDDNAFTYQSVHRTVDGEEAADIPPIRVTRVQTK
jgi:uncharacterized protein (TIGR02246 family)